MAAVGIIKGNKKRVQISPLMMPEAVVTPPECLSFESDDDVSKRCVPTQTQIRQQLGSKLSDVFFEYVGNEGKAYLGLEPPLEGPDVMWINPDARLNKKVRVTPAPEPKSLHLKVFTHETILELGQAYIEKLKNEHSQDMQDALRRQAKDMEENCQKRLEAAAYVNANEANERCKKVVATLMEHFDNCFNDLADTMRLRLRKEYQVLAEEERGEVASFMLSVLQEEIEHRDLELCEEFHDILFNELNVLAEKYIKQINEEREVAVQLIKDTVKNYEKLLQDLRVEMEINNVVDVCTAITQERVACRENAKETAKEMRLRESQFMKYIEDLKAENCTLRKMATERLKRLMQWRTRVREVLQEFQRYINFAMKSVPGQSEFMLNMEKLLLKSYPEDSFLQPEDYLHYKNCLKGKLPESEVVEPQKPEVCKTPTESIEDEITGEVEAVETPTCNAERETISGYTFSYDQFKEMMRKRYASDLTKVKPKRKVKKAICMWKKKPKEINIDKSCELYQMMAIAGENEKQHLAPLECFLHERLSAVKNICQEDPEFATAILGCSDK